MRETQAAELELGQVNGRTLQALVGSLKEIAHEQLLPLQRQLPGC